MRRAAAVLAAALALAACERSTSDGFSLTPPPGWTDATDTAETKTNAEFEAVYAGVAVEGITPTIAISRSDGRHDPPVERATSVAREAVMKAFGASAAPSSLVRDTLDGEPALRFDYRAGAKRARYLQAKRGDRLYAITLEAAPAAFARSLAVMRALQASWMWDVE